MCVIFCMLLCDHSLFLKKFVYACQFFLSNLDFIEPLGVFAATCPLNESLGLRYIDLDV